MRGTTRLRLRDVRGAFRLLGEARELGSDVRLWRRHVLEGLLRLTGARVGISACESLHIGGNASDLTDRVELGWASPHESQLLTAFVRNGSIRRHPGYAYLLRHEATSFTSTRAGMISDAAWSASDVVQEFHRAANCGDFVHSRRVVKGCGWADMIVLHKAWGEPGFDGGALALVRLFHDELARLWNGPRGVHAVVRGLPPHLQRLVGEFRKGRSEKEAAAGLNLSPHTIHAYSKELYRRLEVKSRSEAMALIGWSGDFLPQLPAPRGRVNEIGCQELPSAGTI